MIIRRILLTGASGFVGSQLVCALSSENVCLAVRRAPTHKSDVLNSVAVGDLGGQTNWTPALLGVTTVVHLAGRVHVMKQTEEDRRRFKEVNVFGTERLALAAAEHGVKRFVFLSSI